MTDNVKKFERGCNNMVAFNKGVAKVDIRAKLLECGVDISGEFGR